MCMGKKFSAESNLLKKDITFFYTGVVTSGPSFWGREEIRPLFFFFASFTKAGEKKLLNARLGNEENFLW